MSCSCLVLVAGACVASARAGDACSSADARIVVDTAAHTLALCETGKEVASFGIRLGRGGVGKTKEGDGKTPLGIYPLGVPRKSDRFGTFIPIGYPTPEQRRHGFTGGDIGVHGPPRGFRWLGSLVNTFDLSDGCVGVASDAQIERIAAWVKTARARTIELKEPPRPR